MEATTDTHGGSDSGNGIGIDWGFGGVEPCEHLGPERSLTEYVLDRLQKIDDGEMAQEVVEGLSAGEFGLVLATLFDEPIGFCVYTVRADEFCLNQVYIEAKRSSLMGYMLESVKKQARYFGCKRIIFGTKRSKPMERRLKQFGFEVSPYTRFILEI